MTTSTDRRIIERINEILFLGEHAATDAAETERFNNTLRWFEDVLTHADRMRILVRGWRNMDRDKDRLEMIREYMPDEFELIQRDAEA